MTKGDKFTNLLFIIAIVIMLAGCVLLYREYNMCQNPIENIVVPHLEKEGITDYELVRLTIFQKVGDLVPLDVINYYSDSYVPKNIRRTPIPVLNESKFLNISKK